MRAQELVDEADRIAASLETALDVTPKALGVVQMDLVRAFPFHKLGRHLAAGAVADAGGPAGDAGLPAAKRHGKSGGSGVAAPGASAGNGNGAADSGGAVSGGPLGSGAGAGLPQRRRGGQDRRQRGGTAHGAMHLSLGARDAGDRAVVEEFLTSLPVTRLIGLVCHYTYWHIMRAKVTPPQQHLPKQVRATSSTLPRRGALRCEGRPWPRP